MPEHQTYIAGVKYRHGAREVLDRLPRDAELTLAREPDNRYDRFAVMVMTGDIQLGYVPKELSEDVSKLIDEGRLGKVARSGAGSGITIEFLETLI